MPTQRLEEKRVEECVGEGEREKEHMHVGEKERERAHACERERERERERESALAPPFICFFPPPWACPMQIELS